jgi:hypothetical protein
MAQADAETGQSAPIERSYGRYSAHEQGHSLVTTVPCAVNLSVDTSVRLRACRHRGRVVFLKAVPLAAEVAGRPGTQPETTTDEGTEITDEKIDVYSIWGAEGDDTTEKKLLTIPTKCETDRFSDDTEPLIVAGTVEGDVVYLKVIPECLYQEAGSINTDDLIEASCSEPSTLS